MHAWAVGTLREARLLGALSTPKVSLKQLEEMTTRNRSTVSKNKEEIVGDYIVKASLGQGSFGKVKSK
jgi:hypothetical protein